MDNLLSPEKIKQLEEKLHQQGRSIQCVDARVRPGHPPDYVIRFANGATINTCAYSYEGVLAAATIMKEPQDWKKVS